jgi:histidinol-phosphate aminotransferase
VGLRDYYRQFEDTPEEEINVELRAKAARERALALARVPPLDLSNTEWPRFPNAEIVNAAIAVARGRINGYPDGRATALRELIGSRHGLDPDQIVVGNGASELLQAATFVLVHPGEEMVIPWPSYVQHPVMAYRAGAKPVLVPLREGFADIDAMLEAVTPQTRAMVLCNPNDPTGTYLRAADVRRLLDGLPEQVHLLVDEAFVHFQDLEPRDAVLELVGDDERLLVFRTFSKIYGLSGLRIGYVAGALGSAELLQTIGPALGVNSLSEAAARHALARGDEEIERRRAQVLEQRARFAEGIAGMPLEGPASQANFVWLASPGMSGLELAARLERAQVIVAAGQALGDEEHVRVAIRDELTTTRLLNAFERAFEPH